MTEVVYRRADAVDGEIVADLLSHALALGCPVVLLHGHDHLQPGSRWSGDVDLMVFGDERQELPRLIQASRSAGLVPYTLIRRVRNDLLAGRGTPRQVFLGDKDGQVLSLDVIFAKDRSVFPGMLFDSAEVQPLTGISVTGPAGLAAYLTIKRAQKCDRSVEAWAPVISIAATSARSVAEILGTIASASTVRALLGSLAAGLVPSDGELQGFVRSARANNIAHPFGTARVLLRNLISAFGRVTHSPGLMVVVAGPDGSGKTELADRLVAAAAFRSVTRVHWRPGLLPPLGSLAGKPGSTRSADPHGSPAHGRVMSLVRVMYYWADFVIGYWLKVWPRRVRAGLFLMERGWWDMYVDPRRYRIRAMPRLMRVLGSLVPSDDLLFVLDAPSEVVEKRKQEIAPEEIDRQRAEWRRLSASRAHVHIIDAGAQASVVSTRCLDVMRVRQQERHAMLRDGIQ